MTQIATTIEQMSRLIECGVDENTSDMCQHLRTAIYYTHGYDKLPNTIRNENNYIPAWSLSRLLDFLPKRLRVGLHVYELNMGFEPDEGRFYIRYINTLTDSDLERIKEHIEIV